jgi:hypothetical protein
MPGAQYYDPNCPPPNPRTQLTVPPVQRQMQMTRQQGAGQPVLPKAPCDEGLQVPWDGRAYPYDPTMGKDQYTRINNGRLNLTTPVTVVGATFQRYTALAEATPSDPFSTATVTSLQVFPGYTGYAIYWRLTLNDPSFSQAVQTQLFVGNTRLGDIYTGQMFDNEPYIVWNRAGESQTISVRTIITSDYWSTGTQPIRSLLRAFATLRLELMTSKDVRQRPC